MDKDLPAHVALAHPDLYRNGPLRYYFNMYTFLRWVGAAVYESLVIFAVMSFGFNASEAAPGSESRVEYGMVAFSMTVLTVNLKIWLISDTWTLLALTCWSLSVASWFGFASMGTRLAFFSRLKVSYDEFGSFAPTAWSWGYVLVVLMACVIALGRHFAYNQYQRTFYPELHQVLSEQLEKRSRSRLTITHDVEAQPTLSMSLNDDVQHAGLLMSDFDSRATDLTTTQSFRTNSTGGHTNNTPGFGPTTTHGAGRGHSTATDDRTHSQSDGGDRDVRSTASDHVPLTADSFSASVYSSSVSSDGDGAAWDRVPPKFFKTTTSSLASRRNTGYAFSCDEETTLAESYIASNSLPRSDAVPAALRNSISRHLS